MFQLGIILIVLIVFVTIFGILYVYYITRNRERLSLIEKGASAELFNKGKGSWSSMLALKLGMFLIGIAVGILMGNILYEVTSLAGATCYFSMIFLFGGFSLIIYYFISRAIRGDIE